MEKKIPDFFDDAQLNFQNLLTEVAGAVNFKMSLL